MNKEIPLEALRILLDRWYYANEGELSTLELAQTIEYIEEYDFKYVKERLLQNLKFIFDEQNRLGQI
ncbi:MAG: hypothetical protein J6C08_02600 [Campylobacter sp.]|uniref:hypothetical protein n=1 Tax=Campylobacter sp. TaxID=205 RepID=UPI001B1486D6|nr:hypothetical protein [Campylobacter sp.]MBO5063387.1 hypothetical protein [Campylobacter sp.]